MNREEQLERENRMDLELAVEILLQIQRNIGNKKNQLAGLNLPGLDFSHKKFNSANFSYANLDEVIFSHTLLNGASFQGAKLNKVKMENVALNKAYFVDAELNEVDLSEAILNKADLSRAKLHMSSLYHAQLKRADFKDTELTGTDFGGADLARAKSLTQEQVDTIIYPSGDPPVNIPGKLNLPESRAYIHEKTSTGDLSFKFVESDQPWSGKPVVEWVKKEIKAREAEKPQRIIPTVSRSVYSAS